MVNCQACKETKAFSVTIFARNKNTYYLKKRISRKCKHDCVSFFALLRITGCCEAPAGVWLRRNRCFLPASKNIKLIISEAKNLVVFLGH